MGRPPIRTERSGGIAWCTLDRPPLNLLDPELITGLRETFMALGRDRSVRVAVLGAEGHAFTAGMNVHVLRALDVTGARTLITSLHDALEAVHHAPFPVIAAVHGPCLGAGLELALACDLRVVTRDATFGLPEVRVGLPSVIEAALLPALVGPGRAAELLLTGEPIDAERASAWGLVNRVVPAADLRTAAEALAGAILACAPHAVRLQKELILRWRYGDLASGIQHSISTFALAYTTGEPVEGATAFLEKRPPKFEDLR